MTKKPDKLIEILLDDLHNDINILHATKMYVSHRTVMLLQYIIDSHISQIKGICQRNDINVPAWCDNE